VKSEIEEVCRLGMTEPSESPPYSSFLLMAKNKDGTNRPVVDFRRINKVTTFDAEPMPRADDIYERMANSRYFSTMDFCNGYCPCPQKIGRRQSSARNSGYSILYSCYSDCKTPERDIVE